MRTIFRNALVHASGATFHGWLAVDGKFIAGMGHGAPARSVIQGADSVVDLDGNWLLPGVIDTHVHFREPGLTHKADMASESRAAVAGGVTSILDMPNTVPQTTTLGAWEDKMALAADKCIANYAFFLGASNDNYSQLAHLDMTRIPGVKVFLGSSTGSMLVNSQEALDAIFSLPCLIAVHCEDETTIRENITTLKMAAGDGELPVTLHPVIRSAQACCLATRDAMQRARRLNTRLHVLHLSTAMEVALLSAAPISGKRITAEACVQHLWFTDEDYPAHGARIKCNPAIKTKDDRDMLRQALADGRIDTVATDHAPHLLEEKCGDALTAASGIPLIQYSLPAMLTLARQIGLPTEKVVELMCANPAEIYAIDRRGKLREGYYADMVVVDPHATTVASDGAVFSKCGWTPFHNVEFPVKVMATYVNGQCVYDHGTIHPHQAIPLRFNNSNNPNASTTYIQSRN